jgi:hypothetical protein
MGQRNRKVSGQDDGQTRGGPIRPGQACDGQASRAIIQIIHQLQT